MITVTLVALVVFAWTQIAVRTELPSADSGANFFATAVMVIVLLALSSFATLTVSIDENYLQIKFGYGIFRKKFLLNEITSAKQVKNHWYCGWGIRFCCHPRMCIYNVSGFNAVEIVTKDGKIYRIGTDTPSELETAIKQKLPTNL